MPVKTYGIGGGRSTFKGFSTGNVTDISAESGARKVFLKWRDPEDAILNDVVVSAWAGTIIVRKTGGYPESVKDGIQILDSKVRNTYLTEASVYKGYKRDKIEMRDDRAEMSDFPLYLNTVAGGLDCRNQAIGGFSFVVKIYALPVVEIIGQFLYLLGRYGFDAQIGYCL